MSAPDLQSLQSALEAAQAEVAVLRQQASMHEEVLGGLSHHVPGGLMVLDRLPDGRRFIPWASERLFSLFDIDPALRHDPEGLFMQVVARMHPDHVHKIRLWELEAEGGAKELAGDCLIILRNGQRRWIAVQLGVQHSHRGHRVWYGMLQDVTVRHELALRLAERDALLKSLSRNIPGVLYKINIPAQGEPQLQYISSLARHLYELGDDIDPYDWTLHYTRIHPEDLDYVKGLTRPDNIQLEHPIVYEYRVQLPSKGTRWLAGQAMAFREQNGMLAWYGYTADITDRKQYEQAVITASAAEQANRAKSEFLSRMSHELRTPLNAVLGFAQLLRMDTGGVFGPTQQQHVAQIEKAGNHLLSMLGDVLDLSRIEAGNLPLSLEPQEVRCVVDDAVDLLRELARQRNVNIDIADMPDGCHVQADRVRLRQVLVNLIGNAIKYNRADGTVRIDAHLDQGQVVVSVQDTGIGLTPQQQAHLFEPFNRLGAERSHVDGTGIGLVIVQRLIRLMQGHIDVHSLKGVGSTFRITLPAAVQPTFPAPEPVAAAPAPAARAATILYAEDNEINVILLQQVMTLRPQWTLLVGRDGQRALALARQHTPDLMLIDMHLGDMSGFDLADALDAEPSLQDVPRVALSADAMPDRIHAAKDRGFVAYITKPLDVSALLGCLDGILGQED